MENGLEGLSTEELDAISQVAWAGHEQVEITDDPGDQQDAEHGVNDPTEIEE